MDPASLTPEQLFELQKTALQLRCILDFKQFVQSFWRVLNPGTPLVWNWHHEAICDAVQRQVDGDPAYRRLLVLVPPGSMKSTIVSVMRPAWMWLRKPWRKSLYVHANDDLMAQFSRWTRDIILHPSYQLLVEISVAAKYTTHWSIEKDQNEKENFENTAKGFRQCTTIKSQFTGKRADDICMDDVLDAKAATDGAANQIEENVQEINRIIADRLQSRGTDLETTTWTLIMQRLHEHDPASVAIAAGDWKTLCFPATFNPNHPLRDPLDPRTEEGQPLCPVRYSPSALERLKRPISQGGMRPEHYAAQYDLLPTPAAGGQVKKEWVDAAPRYDVPPEERGASCDVIDISVDATFKGGLTNDRVSIQAWGRQGRRRVLLDIDKRPMGFNDTVAAVRRMAKRWPFYRNIYVEEKANGAAVIDLLSAELRGLRPVNPGTKSKTQRVELGTVPALQDHSIELPTTGVLPAVEDWVREHLAFSPSAAHDDDVDATSQLMLQWNKEEVGAAWVSDEVSAWLELTPTDARPVRAHPLPDRGELRIWQRLPVRSPLEHYHIALVLARARSSAGPPAVGVVQAASGEVVATFQVEDGGEEAIAASLLDIAIALDRGSAMARYTEPMRLRLADPPREHGLAASLASRLSRNRDIFRVVLEPGATDGTVAESYWRDRHYGRAMADAMEALIDGIRGGIEIPDPAIIRAIAAVVVDRETGRPKMGDGAPDLRMIHPDSQMDARVLALALAEEHRQRNGRAFRVVTGTKPASDLVQRWTAPRRTPQGTDTLESITRRVLGQ